MAAKHIAAELGFLTLVSLCETSLAKVLSLNAFAAPRLATVLLANLFLWYSYKCIIYPIYLHPFRKLPRPKKSSFLFGHSSAEFSVPPGQEYLEWVKETPNNGLIAYRALGNEWRLLLTSPETLKAVLSDNVYDWEKPQPISDFLAQVLGRGLILSEGDEHKHQRKALLPAFQYGVIRDLHPVFWSKSVEMVNTIYKEHIDASSVQQARLEIGDWATRATLDIIGIAGFGVDFNSLANPNDELVSTYSELLRPDRASFIYFVACLILSSPVVNLFPSAQRDGMKRISATLKAYALSLVKERRQQAKTKGLQDHQKDLLSMMIRQGQLSDAVVADQVLTILGAGHETTSSAMTWVAYLLAKHPEAQERLRQEIRRTIPSLSSSNVSQSVIDSMPYLNAVCNETLRLYPTVPRTTRRSVRDTFIGDVRVRKGTSVIVAPWVVNRDPALWGANADEFYPDRWLGEGAANTGGATTNYATMTFLHGPRSCIGQGFAKQELKCLTAAFIGQYNVEMDMESDPLPAGVITTKAEGGMHIKIKAVAGW